MTAKVLISEDNPMIQQVFKAFFNDCETKICDTGADTIETALKEKFQLLIQDYYLADDILGTDVALKILDKYPISVLLISASEDIDEQKISKIENHPNIQFFKRIRKGEEFDILKVFKNGLINNSKTFNTNCDIHGPVIKDNTFNIYCGQKEGEKNDD